MNKHSNPANELYSRKLRADRYGNHKISHRRLVDCLLRFSRPGRAGGFEAWKQSNQIDFGGICKRSTLD